MQTLVLDNLPTPVLLVWGLPEDACDIKIKNDKHSDTCRLHYLANFVGLESMSKYVKWLDGNWKLIGKLSELTEGDCRELVKETALYKKLNVRPYRFTSYIDGFMGFQFALESFHSAIEAEGYFVVNPHSKTHFNPEEYIQEEYERFMDAQSKTLPANTLIFKKL